MALIFIPVIGKIFGTDKTLNKKDHSNLKLLETGSLSEIKGLQGKYISLLRYCLDNPKANSSYICIFNFHSNFLRKIWERL